MSQVIRLDHRPTLEEAQTIVGGYIEIIPLLTSQMIVNEEGLIYGLPHNDEASIIAGRPIVGDVIVLTGKNKIR